MDSTSASIKQRPRRKPVRRTSWTAKVTELLRRANGLAATVSESGFPVQVRNLADACQVADIVFKPMLVDGGLGTSERGFTVYVNTQEEKCAQIHDLYSTERLGRTLPVRYRFTIAHELAHTLFYEATPATLPKIYPVAARKENLDRLEVACNKIAAALLLPAKFLAHEKTRLDFLNPNHLRILATRSAVSDKTLSIRLEGSLGDCVIFCCEKQADQWLIASHHAGVGMEGAFQDTIRGTAFETQFPNTGLVIGGGECSKVNYEWQPKASWRFFVPVEIKCEAICDDAQKRLFVIFRRNGIGREK